MQPRRPLVYQHVPRDAAPCPHQRSGPTKDRVNECERESGEKDREAMGQEEDTEETERRIEREWAFIRLPFPFLFTCFAFEAFCQAVTSIQPGAMALQRMWYLPRST